LNNSNGALLALRETPIESPLRSWCRETQSLSGGYPTAPRSREKSGRGRLPKLCDFVTPKLRWSTCSCPAPLIQPVNRIVVFDCENHGLEDVHVPAISDSQANNLGGFRHQPPAQWH